MPFDSLGSCVSLSLTSREACIRFPVGQEICASIPTLPIPDLLEVITQLFAQANSALAPLSPILNIIDAVIAIFECVKAVPDAITQLDPSGLIDCIPGVAEAVNKLLQMIPQLSLPIMILDILTVTIQFLEALKTTMQRALDQITAITNAQLKAAAPGQFALSSVVDCVNLNFGVQLENLNEALGPISRILGLVNFLLDLIGLPKLPLPLPPLSDLSLALTLIDILIDILNGIIGLIPALAPPTTGPQDGC